MPLQFDSSVNVFASYYERVRAGMKVSLFDIELKQLGMPKEGHLRQGILGEKRKVLDLKKPSKKMHQNMSSSSSPNHPDKAAAATMAPSDEGSQGSKKQQLDTSVGVGPPTQSHICERDGAGADGGEAEEEDADNELLEGANCLLEEAELSGHAIDDETDGCGPNDVEMEAGSSGSILEAAAKFISLEAEVLQENLEHIDEDGLNVVGSDALQVEQNRSQIESAKLKEALDSKKHTVTEEVKQAASQIQDEQQILLEEAVIEAAMNDVNVAGNTEYSNEKDTHECGLTGPLAELITQVYLGLCCFPLTASSLVLQ